MIGSSCPNPNPNPASAAPSSSSSSSAPCGGGGGGGGGGSGGDAPRPPMASSDPRVPLLNLAALGRRMESLRRFLADPGDHRSPIADAELRGVSAEIASTVQQIILNGAALLASSHPLDLVAPLPPTDPPTNAAPIASDSPDPPLQAPPPPPPSVPTAEPLPCGGGGGDDRDSEESEIVEIEAEELLAEHIHFCEICGKGFKRDANLRMHMRAHGDRFKTLEALSGSGRTASAAAAAAGPAGRKPVRFSCPFPGCNRNRAHRRFRPLKSAVCVKNHFKRSHCPKMFSCHRCNKKSFSVLADLRSHLKHCGETPWRCSCGTSFSRKDKLFGHLALFEGHFPAVGEEAAAATGKRKEPDINRKAEGPGGGEGFDPDFFEGLMDEFEGISEGNWPAR